MSTCPLCRRTSERVAPHAAQTVEYWKVLELPLKHIARRCGYALALHGSLGFDIDLIAVPWRENAINAHALIDELRTAAEAIIGICEIRERDKKNLPEKKPCGRLAWSLFLVPDDAAFLGPYLDISVMPITGKGTDDENKEKDCQEKSSNSEGSKEDSMAI